MKGNRRNTPRGWITDLDDCSTDLSPNGSDSSPTLRSNTTLSVDIGGTSLSLLPVATAADLVLVRRRTKLNL